jgi:hypothetical protein
MKRIAHTSTQLLTARTCQSDFGRNQISSPDVRNFAGLVDRLADRGGGIRDSNAQRIRWACEAFAQKREI